MKNKKLKCLKKFQFHQLQILMKKRTKRMKTINKKKYNLKQSNQHFIMTINNMNINKYQEKELRGQSISIRRSRMALKKLQSKLLLNNLISNHLHLSIMSAKFLKKCLRLMVLKNICLGFSALHSFKTFIQLNQNISVRAQKITQKP